MVPNKLALRISFQMRTQPITCSHKRRVVGLGPRLAISVVVSQAPLSDGDWVVLQARPSPIVEQWDASSIAIAGVAGFFRKHHVILAQLSCGRARVFLRSVMPKSEMAGARREICTENSLVVLQALSNGHGLFGQNRAAIQRAAGWFQNHGRLRRR